MTIPRFLRHALRLLVLPATLSTSVMPASAQSSSLRLRDVLAAVDTAAYAPRAARADTRAAEADITATMAGWLPALRLEAGAMRTTDPIGVFGARLRQRAVTASDFDPGHLNRPGGLSTVTGAVVLEQPVFAPAALFGRRTAGLAAAATRAAAEHALASVRLEASRAYFGAMLAAASVTALEAAVQAAEAHVTQAVSLERNGVVTRADVLLARVRMRELDAQRATARGRALTARLALAVLMGRPDDTVRTLPDSLPAVTGALRIEGREEQPVFVRSDAPASSLRHDVHAARLAARAARADVTRATARWAPTVGATVRSEWASPDQPFGGTPFWTAGVMISLPLFSGGADVADRQRARALAGAAESRAEAAAARASLEAVEARIERAVAFERLVIADGALAEAREALRLVQRRYDGGLAAVTELLDAAARHTAADLATMSARHDALVALAVERVSHGLDLSPLLALDR